MSKRFALLLLVLLMAGLSFAQTKKVEDRNTISLCWNTDLDTAASYLIYFNRYNSGDTAWRFLGSTKEKTYTLSKSTFKGDIAFGVKSVYYADTSLLHTSLETTACVSGPNCDTLCTPGAWYLNWTIKKPNRMKLK